MRSALLSTEALLKKGLDELSLEYTSAQLRAFLTYLAELKKWNKAYNLTALKTDEEIVTKHFLDSLLYLKAMPEGRISVMDVGSGAGFPGIPIKIMRSEVGMHLLEPSRKKAGFLRHNIRVLELNGIEVWENRIEEAGSLIVDVAVTRALFGIREFAVKALPHVREGGRLILSKGPRVKEELGTIKDTHHEVLALTLPGTDMKRFIVIIHKPARGRNAPAGPRSGEAGQGMLKSGSVCVNAECRLRKAGCTGFEGCPGFKART